MTLAEEIAKRLRELSGDTTTSAVEVDLESLKTKSGSGEE